MLSKFLVAGLFIGAGMFGASAQTNIQPAPGPGATGVPSVSAATHCRDGNGVVRLRTAAPGGSTTGSASNTAPSSSPTTSSSVNSPSNMPGSTQAQANLPPC
jgi:hypothetical protein